VQRRVTKLLVNLKDKPCPERLLTLKLPCLEYHRLCCDIIEVYIQVTARVPQCPAPSFLQGNNNGTQDNSLKLQKNQQMLKIRGNYFSERTISTWNCLPDPVVSAPSVNTLKNCVDNHW
jgi:hypothetical protein